MTDLNHGLWARTQREAQRGAPPRLFLPTTIFLTCLVIETSSYLR